MNNRDRLKDKIRYIKKTKDFSYLINEFEGNEKFKNYYNTNKIAYLLLHNLSGFLHMGLSDTNKFKKADLLKQVKLVESNIKSSDSHSVLELGYGRGANLDYLGHRFPNNKFAGVDISTEPLRKYRRHENVKFIKGDFHNLGNLVDKKFDLIYAIETIYHSNNLSNLFAAIASTLNKNGVFIVIDAYYLINKSKLDKDQRLVCTLVEKGMSVNKFRSLEEFELLAQNAGMKLVTKSDYSKQILPSLYRFEKLAKIYFEHRTVSKLANIILPEMFLGNALAGYIMPDLVNLGTTGYFLHVFQKTGQTHTRERCGDVAPSLSANWRIV